MLKTWPIAAVWRRVTFNTPFAEMAERKGFGRHLNSFFEILIGAGKENGTSTEDLVKAFSQSRAKVITLNRAGRVLHLLPDLYDGLEKLNHKVVVNPSTNCIEKPYLFKHLLEVPRGPVLFEVDALDGMRQNDELFWANFGLLVSMGIPFYTRLRTGTEDRERFYETCHDSYPSAYFVIQRDVVEDQ